MDEEISRVGSTLSPKDLEVLRTLNQIRFDVVMDVLAQKRRAAAAEVDAAEIKAALTSLTARVLRAIVERDLRGEELPA